MIRLGSFHRRWRLEVIIVLVPLLALVVLQYLSSRQLARAELIAHQSTVIHYLDAVATDVRRVYEDAAQTMLAVSGTLLPTSGSTRSLGTSTGSIRRQLA